MDLLQAMELEGSEVDEMDLAIENIEDDLEKEELMNLPNEWIFDLSCTELSQVQNFKDGFQSLGFSKEVDGNQKSVETLSHTTDRCDETHEDVIAKPAMNSTQPTSEDAEKLKGVGKVNKKGVVKKAKVWGPVKPLRRS